MATTVLIVDDHDIFRRMARRVLEDGGYVVVGEAHDGASALVEAHRTAPDAVLLDVLLPDLSGFTVADLLVAMSPRPRVVLTSSRSRVDLAERLAVSAADGFLSKSDLTADSFRAVVALT